MDGLLSTSNNHEIAMLMCENRFINYFFISFVSTMSPHITDLVRTTEHELLLQCYIFTLTRNVTPFMNL